MRLERPPEADAPGMHGTSMGATHDAAAAVAGALGRVALRD
jgi:hypothetical protein